MGEFFVFRFVRLDLGHISLFSILNLRRNRELRLAMDCQLTFELHCIMYPSQVLCYKITNACQNES